MESLFVWIALGVVVIVVLGFILAGFALSPRQQVTRVELIKAPIADVWEALSNLPAQSYWRTGLKNIQMLDDDDGLRWVEHPENGQPVTIRKVKENPTQVLLLDFTHELGHGTREIRCSHVPGGTRVTFTERLETASPFKRMKARRGGGLDKKLDHFIEQLKQKFAAS